MHAQSTTTPAPRTIRMSSHYDRECADCGTPIPPGTRHVYVQYSGNHYQCLPCAVNALVARETPTTPDPLTTVRYATAHRLPVELAYNGTVRTIEPCSITHSREGNLLVHAIRCDCREQRTYRADRIEGATITSVPATTREVMVA